MVRSMDSETHLVSENYYAEELDFQTHIDAVKRSKTVNKGIAIRYSAKDQVLQVSFPKSTSVTSGSLQLFKPENSALDQRFNFNSLKNGTLTVPAKELKKGDWVIKMHYIISGDQYYHEKKMTI